MELIITLATLAVALTVLVKGADFFVDGAKQLGASLGMSPFVIGVFIVGIGTSLPELASSVAGVLNGATEIVVANAVGSNITNILLIVGILATVGGRIVIRQNLLNTELPLFFIATTHFVLSVMDGVVDRIEALLLVGTFGAYLWYLFDHAEEEGDADIMLEGERPALEAKSILYIVGGIAAVLSGAHFTVQSAVTLATMLSVPLGLVSIAAIAIGTSLPELFVSLRSLKSGDAELAIGNIFGSNTFNLLMVVGVSGLVAPLGVDIVVMKLGLWIMLAASGILFVNGLSRRVTRAEGVMMLLFFGFFLVKLTAFV